MFVYVYIKRLPLVCVCACVCYEIQRPDLLNNVSGDPDPPNEGHRGAADLFLYRCIVVYNVDIHCTY